jgi:multiple sugar transport system substrate-binding protein
MTGSAKAVAFAVALVVVSTATTTAADEALVTPVRVGNPSAQTTITVWAQQDYSHLAALAPIADAFHVVFEDWARTHPNVKLEVSMMPALEQHKAKLLLAAAAGRLPDVASIDSFWLPLFAAGGHLQPLNEYWAESDRADFLPFTIDTLSDTRGRVLGLWHETDCRVLFYRKDLVPVPPRTLDDLLREATRIARERRIAGYLYNGGRWEGTVFDNLAMFWGQGGELTDHSGTPIFGEAPHRERMVRVLAFLRDTVARGASPRSVLAGNDYHQLIAAAIAGDVAMFLGGNWQLKELQGALSPEEFAKWDIAPIPQMQADQYATGTGGWVWVVFARDPAKRRAAAEFILDVESPAHAARISAATGHLPVRRSVYRDSPVFADRWFSRFGEMLAFGKARPAAAIYDTISSELQIAIGDAIAGRKTPEQAVDTAWSNVVVQHQRRQSTAPRGDDPIRWVPMAAAALAIGLVLFLSGRGANVRAWIAPAAVLIGAVLLYPIFELIRIAATNMRAPGTGYVYTLDGIRSFISDPQFVGMVGVTLAFVVACVTLQIGLGLLLAWLFDAAERRHVRGALGARMAVVGAWIVPGVLVGVIWKILLIENRSGIVNYWLSQAGIGPAPLLSSSALALVSVIVANTWRGCAFSMLLQYAGLRRIPAELHEAADLEGLSAWQRLRWVIVPQAMPVIVLNLLLITIYTLNTFDLILPLTGGGPARHTEVISLYMYRSAFYDLDASRAAAVAVVMLVINCALAWSAARLILRRNVTTSEEAR